MTASPDFEPPTQPTVPFLKAKSPSPYQIPRLRPKDAQQPQTLTFEIQSEDLNQANFLDGLVILDFPGFGRPFPDDLQHTLATIEIPPGHLTPPSGGPRLVTTDFRFPSRITLGCHSVSVIVSHNFKNTLTFEPVRADDRAILTWWYLLLPSPEMGDLPADATQCFSAPDAIGDGGSEAGADGAAVTTP